MQLLETYYNEDFKSMIHVISAIGFWISIGLIAWYIIYIRFFLPDDKATEKWVGNVLWAGIVCLAISACLFATAGNMLTIESQFRQDSNFNANEAEVNKIPDPE